MIIIVVSLLLLICIITSYVTKSTALVSHVFIESKLAHRELYPVRATCATVATLYLLPLLITLSSWLELCWAGESPKTWQYETSPLPGIKPNLGDWMGCSGGRQCTKVGEADLSVSRLPFLGPFQSGMPPKLMMQTLCLERSHWCPSWVKVPAPHVATLSPDRFLSKLNHSIFGPDGEHPPKMKFIG